MASVVVDSFHYVKTDHHDEALFDLASDPEEQHDLAKFGRVPDTLERLRAVMSSARSDDRARAGAPMTEGAMGPVSSALGLQEHRRSIVK